MSKAAQIARDYAERGWAPLPIPTRKKRPMIKGWTQLRMPPHEVDGHFPSDPMNIGILLGEASSHLVDVDLDCSEACRVAPLLLPKTNAIFGRSSKPLSHYLYSCSTESKIFKDPERRDTLLEIRSDSLQTVFPGSVHVSGEQVEWYEDGAVSNVGKQELVAAAQRLAAASTLGRRWPAEGGRHNAQLILSAILTRGGWTADDVAQFVEAVSLAAGAEPQYPKRLATAQDAARRLKEGGKLYGWPSFAELVAEEVATQVADWLAMTKGNRISSGTKIGAAPRILTIGSEVEIAKKVIEDLHAEHGDVVFDEGRIWHFDGICWLPKCERDLRLCVQQYDGALYTPPASKTSVVRLNSSRIDSVLRELFVLLEQPGFFSDARAGMNCASGFITFETEGKPDLIPHSPDHRSRYCVRGKWPYLGPEEEAEASLLSLLLGGCFLGDHDAKGKIDLIAEVGAAAALGFATKLLQPRAVVFYGRSAENGKSQVLDLIRGMLPIEAVAAVPAHRFTDDKYLVQLAGKLLNASDELATARAVGAETFKLVITGEPVTARDVYRPAQQFRCPAQHVFATNQLPDFKGGMDRGVRRRLRVLTFDRTIPEDERVPGIGRRICDEEPSLALDFFVQGAGRLIRQRKFSEPASSGIAEREWLIGSDPVSAWLEEEVIIDAAAEPYPVSEAHRQFIRWATEEGFANDALPPVNIFSQRVRAADPQVKNTRTGTGRYLTGIRIRHARPARHRTAFGGGR